jgi:transposase
MWHVGVDLHRESLMVAAVDDRGQVRTPVHMPCADTDAIASWFKKLKSFRAVIEATGTYRWLYRLLAPLGTVLLAHPLRLRAMVQRRSKTDRLDSQLLAQLLRLNQIPLAYIPSEKYQYLRDFMRYRTRLSRQLTQAKIQMREILAKANMNAPFAYPFGPRGLYWFSRQEFGGIGNQMRDHLLERMAWTGKQLAAIDEQMKAHEKEYPEVAALLELPGIGLFTGLMVIGEYGDVRRFRHAKQAAAYSGLTTRVFQSGDTCRTGRISKLGSPYLRWVLVESAMKFVAKDNKVAAFYQRIRKRSGTKIARVAAARKLAEICYKRLMRWHAAHDAEAGHSQAA